VAALAWQSSVLMHAQRLVAWPTAAMALEMAPK
jgi:hypothetical protein